MRLLVKWLISAIALMVVAYFVPGFEVRGFVAALIAAAVIGFINATLGTLVKVVTFPITILTLGLFLIVVNAIMLKIAAVFVPGFVVRSWLAAIIGAILLSLVSSLLHWVIGDERRERSYR
ncbi:MAG TPA: phage holin family protein [Candidatus Angelobacter sp.]|nr:phage holin family protein [Candidatus Angelobacter sp.]